MRSGVGLALSGGPGRELSIEWAAPMPELCETNTATTAKAGASGAPLVESNAAVQIPGACVAPQTAGPVEWQQAEATTQCCCETAVCIVSREVAPRHWMPQAALANGATTNRRINARASCARRNIWFSVACAGNSLHSHQILRAPFARTASRRLSWRSPHLVILSEAKNLQFAGSPRAHRERDHRCPG